VDYPGTENNDQKMRSMLKDMVSKLGIEQDMKDRMLMHLEEMQKKVKETGSS